MVRTNEDIAQRLLAYAGQLRRSGESLYRIRAYRRAAEAVLAQNAPVAGMNETQLFDLPGIGRSLARTIATYAATGQWIASERVAASSCSTALGHLR